MGTVTGYRLADCLLQHANPTAPTIFLRTASGPLPPHTPTPPTSTLSARPLGTAACTGTPPNCGETPPHTDTVPPHQAGVPPVPTAPDRPPLRRLRRPGCRGRVAEGLREVGRTSRPTALAARAAAHVDPRRPVCRGAVAERSAGGGGGRAGHDARRTAARCRYGRSVRWGRRARGALPVRARPRWVRRRALVLGGPAVTHLFAEAAPADVAAWAAVAAPTGWAATRRRSCSGVEQRRRYWPARRWCRPVSRRPRAGHRGRR